MDSAAAWGFLAGLGMALLVDEVAGLRHKGAGGHLPVLAALKPVAVEQFTKVPASGVDHRRFLDATPRLSIGQLTVIAERIPVAMVGRIRARCLGVGAGYDELRHLH